MLKRFFYILLLDFRIKEEADSRHRRRHRWAERPRLLQVHTSSSRMAVIKLPAVRPSLFLTIHRLATIFFVNAGYYSGQAPQPGAPPVPQGQYGFPGYSYGTQPSGTQEN